MIRCTVLTTLMFCLVAATASPCFGKEGEDPTGKVFPWLGDFISNRDQVLQRFAYSAVGEYWRQPPKEAPQLYPFCHLKIQDAKSRWNFDAYGKPFPQRFALSSQSESWQQFLQCDRKFKIKSGTIRAEKPYRTKPKEMRLSAFEQECAYYPTYFEPFDDIVMIATFLTHSEPNPRAAEKVFLEGANLISASESVQNTIRSEWHWKWGDGDLDIVMVQSPAQGNMPIRVDYTDRQSKYKNFFSETHIDWKEQNGLWVPVRINAATVVNAIMPEPTSTQTLVKIDWLVGDEVTDEFLQSDAPDHRIPLMKAFGRRFDVVIDGKTVTGDPWDRPADLEIEVAKKSMADRKTEP